MRKGLVSTIIPVYNRPKMLQEAVASVLGQTYRPIEIIIVDDGSTDETPQVVDALARAHPDEIQVVHSNNSGPGIAREKGRQLARGEFIQYLDSDDLLLPGKFSLQVKGLKHNGDCGVAYGMTRYRYGDGEVETSPWKRSGERISTMFPSFLESRWWDTPTPLYRALVCNAAGPWTDLNLEEDWEYDCRVAATGVHLYYVPKYVCEVRDHENNRLCRGQAGDRKRMSERVRAHRLIFRHAREAGITADTPEMQHFARELFLLCRQCGAIGLVREAAILFELAREAAGEQQSKGVDFRIYKILANFCGWEIPGKISCYADRFRS